MASKNEIVNNEEILVSIWTDTHFASARSELNAQNRLYNLIRLGDFLHDNIYKTRTDELRAVSRSIYELYRRKRKEYDISAAENANETLQSTIGRTSKGVSETVTSRRIITDEMNKKADDYLRESLGRFGANPLVDSKLYQALITKGAYYLENSLMGFGE